MADLESLSDYVTVEKLCVLIDTRIFISYISIYIKILILNIECTFLYFDNFKRKTTLLFNLGIRRRRRAHGAPIKVNPCF
jgi:hypothetical protein